MKKKRKRKKRKKRQKILRFPRLSTPKDELRRIEMILRITYNKILTSRRFIKSFRPYDIYKVKRGGDDAKRCFIILADTLYKEHIDPSLYLKVLSKYGRYENSPYLPPPGWLMTTKALHVFDWMVEKQKKKFTRNQDWLDHLNDPGQENSQHITSAIKQSWKSVHEIMDLWDVKVGTATVFLMDSLSPWFLAISFSFHRMKGLRILRKEDEAIAEKCLKHLIYDKKSFDVAWKAFNKFK